MPAGIYQIRNLVNDKIYVGSTIGFRKREYDHLYLLKNNCHYNSLLQNAYNKYGEENLVFEPLIICDKDNILLYEQMFLDKFNPEYNICPAAGSNLGRKFPNKTLTKEHAEKISKSNVGKKRTQESIEKQRQKLLGRKLSEEHKKKIRKSGLGRKLTMETKEKLSKAKSGENAWNHRLKDTEIAEIRKIYNSGNYKQSQIAKVYNIYPGYISRLVRGERRPLAGG